MGAMTVTPDPAATLRLDDRLCLALYTASRAMTARYRPALAPLGLTYPQYLVMVLLWEDGACTVGQIGARLHLDSSTLSPLLKRLEAMGLVARSRDQRDERTVNVGTTPRGQALRAQAATVPGQICEATALGAEQQGHLVAELHRLATELELSTESIARD